MTPRAYQLMPHIMELLRQRQHQTISRAEIKEYLTPIVSYRGLRWREQALGWGLKYLVQDERIERRSRGFYCILPKGLGAFTEDDGRRLTRVFEPSTWDIKA